MLIFDKWEGLVLENIVFLTLLTDGDEKEFMGECFLSLLFGDEEELESVIDNFLSLQTP